MRKSYARHVMANNLITTTNKFPSAAMARVAYLLNGNEHAAGGRAKTLVDPQSTRSTRRSLAFQFEFLSMYTLLHIYIYITARSNLIWARIIEYTCHEDPVRMVVMACHIMSYHVMSWIDALCSFRSYFIHQVTPIRIQWIRSLDRMGSSPVWSSSTIKMRMTGSQFRCEWSSRDSRWVYLIEIHLHLQLQLQLHPISSTSQLIHGQGAS